MEEAIEEALMAKEKYKRQRKQLAERKKTSYSARSGQGVATQIKNFADNYKSSFLGTRNVGAGVSHQMSSDSYRRGDLHPSSGAVVQASGRCDSERSTSNFKKAQRAVKKRLFDDEGRKFGMGGDLKEKLRLNNKQLRLVIDLLNVKVFNYQMIHIRGLKNKFESPPPPRYSSSSNKSEASQSSDRRAHQIGPIHSEPRLRGREESKPMSLTETQNGSRILSSPPHFNRETKSREGCSSNGLYNNRRETNLDLTIGKRKSEYWTNASDVESDLSFCGVQIECFDM